jgi:hypothetical protein
MNTEAILHESVRRLLEAQPGSRNDALNRAAFRLGRLVAAGQLARERVEAELLNTARQIGLLDEESMRTIRSGLEAGLEAGAVSPEVAENVEKVVGDGPVPLTTTCPDTFVVTVWADKKTPRNGKESAITWDGIASMLETPFEAKTDAKTAKDDLQMLAFASFEDGYRKKSNVIAHSCLVLDVDSGGVSQQDLEEHLAGATFLAHTTFSHTPEHPKWRVIIPLSRSVQPSEYVRLWTWATSVVPGVDLVTKDPSRGYFVPCHRPGHEYVPFAHFTGQFLDVDGVPEAQEESVPPRQGQGASDVHQTIVPAPEAVEEVDLGIRPLRHLGEGEWLSAKPAPRKALLTFTTGGKTRDYLLLGKTGMIAGAGGHSKTSSLCYLVMSVATGRQWLGTFDVAEPGEVLLVLGEEDGEEIMRRMQSIARALNLTESERQLAYDRIHVLPAYGTDVRLCDGAGVSTWVHDQLLKHLHRGKIEWKLVVLDPASRFMSSASENDAASATRFVEALERLTSVPGGPCVLCAHHLSKGAMRTGDKDQGAPRGSSALVDGVRWLAVFDRPQLKTEELDQLGVSGVSGDGLVRLGIHKTNYTPRSDRPHYFRVSEGGVLVPATGQNPGADLRFLGAEGDGEEAESRVPPTDPFAGLA